MHGLHPAGVLADQFDISRRATERYAVVSAVNERRAPHPRELGPRRPSLAQRWS